MKRFLTIFLVVVMLISTTACGQSNKQNTQQETKPEMTQEEINKKVEFYKNYLDNEQFQNLEFNNKTTSREYSILNHTVTKQYSKNGSKKLAIQIDNYYIKLYVSPENQQLVQMRVPNEDFSQTISGWYQNDEIDFEELLSLYFHTEEVDEILPTIKQFTKSVKYIRTAEGVDYTIFTVDDGNETVEIEVTIDTKSGEIISFNNIEIDDRNVSMKLLPTINGDIPHPENVKQTSKNNFEQLEMVFFASVANGYLPIQ